MILDFEPPRLFGGCYLVKLICRPTGSLTGSRLSSEWRTETEKWTQTFQRLKCMRSMKTTAKYSNTTWVTCELNLCIGLVEYSLFLIRIWIVQAIGENNILYCVTIVVRLHFVDSIFEVLQILPTALAFLPNSNQPKHNWADSGTTKAKSTKPSPWPPWSPCISYFIRSSWFFSVPKCVGGPRGPFHGAPTQPRKWLELARGSLRQPL